MSCRERQPAALPRALPVQNSSASLCPVCFFNSTDTKPQPQWGHTGPQHSQLQVSQPSCLSSSRETDPQVKQRSQPGQFCLITATGFYQFLSSSQGVEHVPPRAGVRSGLALEGQGKAVPGCHKVPAAFWMGAAARGHSFSSPCCACPSNLLIFSVRGMHSQKWTGRSQCTQKCHRTAYMEIDHDHSHRG